MSVESTQKLVERAPVDWGFITNPGVKFPGSGPWGWLP